MKEKIIKHISQLSEAAIEELSNNRGSEKEELQQEEITRSFLSRSGATSYTNSSLVSYKKISPNRNSPRNHAIDTITIHCVVGQVTVQSLGDVFAPSSRQASSNYGVGYDGKIGMYCEEKDRSWCTSSAANDNRAITIEVASDTKEPYAVKDAAYNALINLVADICKRNGIEKLTWSTNKTTRMNHSNGCNMTVHRDYAAKSCPGTYLYDRMGDIALKVNAKLGSTTTVTPSPSNGKLVAGAEMKLSGVNLYTSATATSAAKTITGTYYVWGTEVISNRIRITNSKNRVGVQGQVTGYINLSDSGLTQQSTPTPEVKKLYRVRKSKDDAKTQYGAYASFENAKTACQAAGPGYSVFDWNYNVVYTYQAPKEDNKPQVNPEPEKEFKKVYDLDYPVKTPIIVTSVSNEDKKNEKCTRAIKYIVANNSSFNTDIAKAFFTIGTKYNIDPEMAICQSILETGWFKFAGSSVKSEQHNYCGLGATGGGVSGASFATIEQGVTAQYQHLYAYGSKSALPKGETVIDPRFEMVTRGIATYWQQLAGRWAVPGYDTSKYKTPEDAMKENNTYGQKILKLYQELQKVIITNEDIEKYFPSEKPVNPDPVKPDPVQPDDNNDNNENVSVILNLLRKLLEFFVKMFGLDKGE